MQIKNTVGCACARRVLFDSRSDKLCSALSICFNYWNANLIGLFCLCPCTQVIPNRPDQSADRRKPSTCQRASFQLQHQDSNPIRRRWPPLPEPRRPTTPRRHSSCETSWGASSSTAGSSSPSPHSPAWPSSSSSASSIATGSHRYGCHGNRRHDSATGNVIFSIHYQFLSLLFRMCFSHYNIYFRNRVVSKTVSSALRHRTAHFLSITDCFLNLNPFIGPPYSCQSRIIF